MTESIFRYVLEITDDQTITMPVGAHILCVERHLNSESHAEIWAMVNGKAKMESRRFIFRGTGNHMDGTEGRYVGTIQTNNGVLVWHLFEYRED